MFGSDAAANFSRQITAKTGLYPQGDRFCGVFQGLNAWTQTQMVSDMAGAFRGNGGAFGLMGALIGGHDGGMLTGMTGGEVFMKYDYVIELPNVLPGASIRESTTLLFDKNWQQRKPVGQRMSCGIPWMDAKYETCAIDPGFLHYVCASIELQQCLQRWHYVNLSWYGREVWVEVLESGTRVASQWGASAMQNGDMTLGGLWLAAAAARATFAR